MKNKKFIFIAGLLFVLGSFIQCERSEVLRGPGVDDDSDRPEWAGGNTDANEHNKQGDGGTNGGNTVDYGDLYVLLRDADGVPEMRKIDVFDEEGLPDGSIYVVQPVDVNGETVELDGEGGVVDPTQAIPVDFGRLNIVRSPQSVLDQALGEALKVINAGVAFSLDFCGRLSIWNYDEVVDSETFGELIVTKTIDSPRENMAIYQEIMNNGFENDLLKLKLWNELSLEAYDIDPFTLAASCFAAGSDKTGTVNIDEVVYINGFMGNYGCDPLINVNEEDKYNDWDWKHYWNYGDCDCQLDGDQPFTYNRNVYQNREIKILSINPDGTWTQVVEKVFDALTDRGLFTYKNVGDLERVDGFAAAVDDAVQVLEFIHGDSNIEFLPVTPPVPIWE